MRLLVAFMFAVASFGIGGVAVGRGVDIPSPPAQARCGVQVLHVSMRAGPQLCARPLALIQIGHKEFRTYRT